MISSLTNFAFSKTINTLLNTYNIESNKSMNNYQDIISKIKFIGTIQQYEKINTKHLYIQQAGLYTKIDRMFFNTDTRTGTLQFIQDITSRAFELVITLERTTIQEEKILYENLINDLYKSKCGLSNLKITYQDDSKFCCDIDAIMEIIDAKLSSRKHLIKNESIIKTDTDIQLDPDLTQKKQMCETHINSTHTETFENAL